MRKQITLSQVVTTALDTLKASLYVRMPGTVVAYHADSMTADIQPMTNDPRTDIDTGGIVPEPWPVILNVRIAWPRFGNFVLVGQLNQFDPVTLEAFDLDPNPAWKAGRSNNPVNPDDVRRLSGGYWSATPTNLTGPIKDVAELAALAAMLGIDGDSAQILFAAAAVTVGKAGASVALSGGGPAVGRVGDAVQVTLTPAEIAAALGTITSPPGGGTCTVAGGSSQTASGTITAGSPKVTSG